jgi:plasmid replication initiation protein
VKIREEGIGKPTTISFEFPSTVLDTIKRPNMFVKLDLIIIKGLESKHSIILYEFIKDYLNLGKICCEIPLFRKLMGIQPNQYENFTMLKKRVLDIAVQEINEKTDITVSFDFEKIGRINTAVLFTMQPKQNTQEDNTLTDTVKTKLRFYGIQDETISQLIQKHDLEYILTNLQIVEEQIQKGKIQNVTGYLLKAFQSDFRA